MVKVYPQDTARRFEFDVVLEELQRYCRSSKAKELAAALEPMVDRDAIAIALDQTVELVEAKQQGAPIPDYYIPNVASELKKLSISHSVLDGPSLIKLRSVADVANNVIRFFSKHKAEYPATYQIIDGLDSSKELLKLIDRVLDPNGEVRSSASRELAAIRRELSQLRIKANKTFDGCLRKYRKLEWLRDFEESFVNGRRVLAVLAENKRRIDGNLHGASESGATAFIEPAEMIGINNEILDAQQREAKEVYRILAELTRQVRHYHPLLASYEYAMGYLDFSHAKALLALDLDANRPAISKKGNIQLMEAIHPVLYLQNREEGKPTVPVSIELDKQQRILVISGPNAGGKSISMKTLGLNQMMFQAGMLLPAADHSEMTIFKQLFVDIGDDQSIAHELSTYSSRLHKMKHFLASTDSDTLFFIDELGTGSDPELGGAIAETILEELAKSKAFGMVTTHYSNLKILAQDHPNMQNASMLFDEETLKPQYVLRIGHPGSSYTFEVAEKIGLPKPLIDQAKQRLDDRKVNLDKLLITLQTNKNKLNKETHQLQQEKSQLKQEVKQLKADEERYFEREMELNYDENKKLIERGKEYEKLLKIWRTQRNKQELMKRIIKAAEKDQEEKQQPKKLSKAERQEKARKEWEREREKRAAKIEKEVQEEANRQPITVGDTVRMKDASQEGEVQDISKDKATVLFGMMKTIVPLEELRRVGG